LRPVKTAPLVRMAVPPLQDLLRRHQSMFGECCQKTTWQHTVETYMGYAPAETLFIFPRVEEEAVANHRFMGLNRLRKFDKLVSDINRSVGDKSLFAAINGITCPYRSITEENFLKEEHRTASLLNMIQPFLVVLVGDEVAEHFAVQFRDYNMETFPATKDWPGWTHGYASIALYEELTALEEEWHRRNHDESKLQLRTKPSLSTIVFNWRLSCISIPCIDKMLDNKITNHAISIAKKITDVRKKHEAITFT